MLERLVGRQRPQGHRVELAGGGGPTEAPEALHLLLGKAADVLEIRETLRRGESVPAPPVTQVDLLPELGGETVAHRGGLGHPHPVRQQGPGRRLVGGAEADGPSARVAGQQRADHLVALPHGGETCAVDVQGQDPLDLVAQRLVVHPSRVVGDCQGRDPVVLVDPHADGPPGALDREDEVQATVGDGGQGPGPADTQGEGDHLSGRRGR